jgi:hypothetical protein
MSAGNQSITGGLQNLGGTLISAAGIKGFTPSDAQIGANRDIKLAKINSKLEMAKLK